MQRCAAAVCTLAIALRSRVGAGEVHGIDASPEMIDVAREKAAKAGSAIDFQLALIEAGNLDGLVLGRLRVMDRLRAGPRESVYRVHDPTRVEGPTRGVFLLRHLAEPEMEDAVRPDEFRQRFAAARDAAHPNLAATVEVLEINGRPALGISALPGRTPKIVW